MINKTDKLISALALFVLLAFFAGFAIINFCGMADFIDGDMYADMLVARHMWEQNSLFPEGWVFGNQYYVIATPVFAALFYGITGSMNLSMALATSLMSVLIVLSFVWLVRPFVRERSLIILGFLAFTAALITPNAMIEPMGQLFFTLASYYACYLITMFFVFGDYLRAAEDDSLRPAALAAALVLCFCTGMQSMRQMLIMALPVLCLELLLTLHRALRGEKPFRAVTALRAALYCAAELAGYVLMLILKIPSVTIYGNVAMETERTLGERVSDIWHAWSCISGFDFIHNSAFSRFTLLHFGFFCVSTAAALVIILLRIRKRPAALDILWLLNAASICGVFAVGLLFSVTVRTIYIFMWYVLEAVSFLVIAEALKPAPRRVYALLLCIISLWNFSYSYGDNIKTALEPDDPELVAFADWCRENDIKYIYGSWSCARYAAYTDGAAVAGFHAAYWFDVLPYINEQGIYSEEDNAHAVHLLYKTEYEPTAELLKAEGCEVSFVGNYGDWTAFTVSRQIMY